MNSLFLRSSARSTIPRTLVVAFCCRPAATMSTSQQSNPAGEKAAAAAAAQKMANGGKGGNAKGAKAEEKKELKILMLHGYTQSGTLFKAKTGALSKLLVKALGAPPLNHAPALLYPTGPLNLRPSDIPGYEAGAEAAETGADAGPTDNWAWFRRDDGTGSYRGLAAGMARVAEAIRDAGGVDGVMGFSQGGAMAAMVAAALEPERAVPSSSSSSSSASEKNDGDDDEPPAEQWVRTLREANGHRPLRFAVVYSGFYARDDALAAWLYAGGLATPSLHVIGGLDTVVDEARSAGLVERCGPTARQVVHPGGHYVPVGKEWTMAVVGFLRDVLVREQAEAGAGAEVRKGAL